MTITEQCPCGQKLSLGYLSRDDIEEGPAAPLLAEFREAHAKHRLRNLDARLHQLDTWQPSMVISVADPDTALRVVAGLDTAGREGTD